MILAASSSPTARGDEPAADDDERRAVEELARKFGLRGFRSCEPTDHYFAIGDAPEKFQAEALKLCEGLAADYLDHFRKKGFAVETPTSRLTVVALANAAGFEALTGIAKGSAVGGTYDLQTNRLIIFDNRFGGAAKAGRANTVSLFHEATHQLTFNTGLLIRLADVPLVISEGLGVYGEVRRPSGSTPLGAENKDRLDVLAQALRPSRTRPPVRPPEMGLLPLSALWRDDKLFEDPAQQQLAYAQAWLLVYYLMRNEECQAKFRSYLAALRDRRDSSSRLEDARDHFGDLAALQRELTKYARQKI